MRLPPRFSILTLFFLFPLYLFCQQVKQYAFTHIKTTDGLASNVINNVVQDHKGFIWLSTINGLQRYDGNKFLTFKSETNDPASLPSDEVKWVYEDRNKRLWVCTGDNKVGLFDEGLFRYKEVPVRTTLQHNMYLPKTLLETAEGQLLLHFNKSDKLFVYQSASNEFVPTDVIPFPKNWTINLIIQDTLSRKFFMASDSGFAVFNPQTKRLSYPGHNAEEEPLLTFYGTERFINYLKIDSRRRLFFEQWNKSAVHPLLKGFDLKNHQRWQHNLKQQYKLGYHEINGILEQHNGKFWLYGLPFLGEYTGGSDPVQFIKKDYNKEKDIKFNKVLHLYEDRQHNLWTCTDNGIYLFNPDAHLFDNYSLTIPERFSVEGRAQTAYQHINGQVWLGYRDLGLQCFDATFKPVPIPASIAPYQKMKSVWDIHRHSKTGWIWLALQGGNLIIYDPATQEAQHLSPPAFERRAITQIAEDQAGNLWLGTQGGNIVKWDYKAAAKNRDSGFTLVHKTGRIDKLFTDNKGYIWVAAQGEGVLKIDPQKNQVVASLSKNGGKGFQLWSNATTDIIQYSDSQLVVASGALNIINTNHLRVQHISTQEGLPSNSVMSLVKDGNGKLWLGTLNGLCRADLEKQNFTLFNHSDGIQNDDFNIGGAHALNDGRLLFTTEESFVVFNPANVQQAATATKAYITDFKLSNISLCMDSLLRLEDVELSYDQNSLILEFSALNYCEQNKLDYYYQLQGFDKDWIKSDGRHQAIYSYLPPGEYTFAVKTKNLDGVFSNDVTTLNILVSPPFWETWWFYSLLVLAVVTVLYLIDHERVKRLIDLQHVRTDIANQLHEDVSTTLNNINVLSQIAKLKLEKDMERSKELIDQIGEKSYTMVIAMDDMLWSIDPDNDSMEKTLLRIMEHAKTLESSYGARINIEVDEKVKALKLDMKVRYEFLLICKEALENLAPYAKDKDLLVDISLSKSRIVLKVLSKGPAAEMNYEGIMELKKKTKQRADVIAANLDFTATQKETSIVLLVPF